MQETALDIASTIRSSAHPAKRVNVTELARGKAWREQLPECDIMEIVDRGTSAGWLVSKNGMNAILDTIDDLEERLEKASMAAIIDARRDYENWMEGDELAKAALETFAKHGDEMKAALDAD